MVAEFTWLDQVGDGEDSAEQDTETGYHYVCDAEKGVAATHYRARSDYDGFCAAVFMDGED